MSVVVVVIEDKSCTTSLDLVKLVDLVSYVRIPYGGIAFNVRSNKGFECLGLGVSGAR